MPRFTETEAQDDFDRLVDMAIAGQEVPIARCGRVIASFVGSSGRADQSNDAFLTLAKPCPGRLEVLAKMPDRPPVARDEVRETSSLPNAFFHGGPLPVASPVADGVSRRRLSRAGQIQASLFADQNPCIDA